MTDPPREPSALHRRPLDVLLVGGGARAQAWLAPLRRSPRLRAVGQVVRSADQAGAGLPVHRSLEDAMRQHPHAAFAVALPPRAGLDAALQLAAAGRAGVVEAPLHDALCDVELGAGAADVRVAHGWATLAAVRTVQAGLRRARSGRLHIEVAGLPEEPGGDLDERLVHALALARALLPDATPTTARQIDATALLVELAAPSPEGGWIVALRVLGHAQRLAVRLETGSDALLWEWRPDHEHVSLASQSLVDRTTPPAPVRALAQLLGDAARGDDLGDAAAVLRLARNCRALLPTQLPIGARPLRQSAAIARRRPDALPDRLGLRGELPAPDAEPPAPIDLEAPPEPAELWAFRAGLKPVAFLTLPPALVDATVALFGDAVCERRERRVRIESQDHWADRRDEGEPRVEVYIARDAALARRAAHLQADVDPTQALPALGELCGYPPCCVAAFAAQDDRANNSRNRYCSYARTLAPDGSSPRPWPWELNNLHTVVAPFYPCSYRCERALAWARVVIAESGRTNPRYPSALRAWLSRPVLYFDHDHQLVLDGRGDGDGVRYRRVALPPWASPGFAALAGAIGGGDRIVLNDRELVVERDGRVILRLERTDPALGFIAPFGAQAAG